MFLVSCAGTIKTTKFDKEKVNTYKKTYIISAKNSQYIKFHFGTITPFPIYIPADIPAQNAAVIGNTAEVIKQELEKNGIQAVIGSKDNIPPTDFDLIIEYYDVWRWDFKKILDRLDLLFIAPSGEGLIAKSTFTIYKNKELHNFPTPEKEVPKMIKEFLNP
ncbi:hypothetical protein [Flavobacterium sp. 7A]|uniref:hypothetical protein n=1 Tax=Flavobacterium sp. 7A TaxID=2940571 RepID=UPI002227A113|nr:hypothetical protein [Flavobacterium sp. 7A]MCW2118422.1 hypothetical protein [Flavobacterium sp. 7A]